MPASEISFDALEVIEYDVIYEDEDLPNVAKSHLYTFASHLNVARVEAECEHFPCFEHHHTG